MNVQGRLVTRGFTIALLALACSGNVVEPDPDSETHWLARCSTTSECPEGASCSCGICTRTCDDPSACGSDVSAACVTTDAIATCTSSATGSLCVATCEGPCPTGTECRGSLCLPARPPPAFQVENPTGTCEPSDDGSRRGTHTPEPGDVYLPDCDLPVAREYWRVCARGAESAYTFPRLDGSPMLRLVCRDAGYPISPLVERYGLCAAATTPAEVDRVNDMLPADALAITHWLHGQLVFRGTDQGVEPPPFPNDVLDACALHPGSRSPELVSVCDEERARLDSGHDIGLSYAAVGLELARLLNELYGIEASELAVFGPELCSLPEDGGSCFGDFTMYRYDPAAAACVPFTWGGCEGNANRFETEAQCQALCGSRRATECTPEGTCALCPVGLDASGLACSDAGLLCTFGGCGGGKCECIENASGSLVWACFLHAC
jgi:hypothetical protein